jgi:hypothetical protein
MPMNGPHLNPTSVAAESVHDDRIIAWPISEKAWKVGKPAGSAAGTVASYARSIIHPRLPRPRSASATVVFPVHCATGSRKRAASVKRCWAIEVQPRRGASPNVMAHSSAVRLGRSPWSMKDA